MTIDLGPGQAHAYNCTAQKLSVITAIGSAVVGNSPGRLVQLRNTCPTPEQALHFHIDSSPRSIDTSIEAGSSL